MQLQAFIVEQRDALTAEWMSIASTLQACGDRSPAELRDRGAALLRASAAGGSAAGSPRAPGTGEQLTEQLAEYRALRTAVSRRWTQHRGTACADVLDQLARFFDCIDQAVAESLARFGEEQPTMPGPLGLAADEPALTGARLTEIVHAQDRPSDITQRRQAEQALREIDLRKDRFLATLAHELRSPLAPIVLAAAVALRNEPIPAALRASPEVIARQSARMARLFDDLLDVCRIAQGRLELRRKPVDAAEVVRCAIETAMPQIAARHHPLRVLLPDEPTVFDGDALRLAQAVANLLAYAARYSAPDSPIDLQVRHAGQAGEIAVVDDNIDAADSLALLLALLLRLQGHEVRVACGGEQARAITAQFEPRIVIPDIGMPGMDGFEVARRLREARPAGPPWLVALSGRCQSADRQRSADAGFDLHLTKPVHERTLAQVFATAAAPLQPPEAPPCPLPHPSALP